MPDDRIVRILNQVRAFYAAGKKSSNKVYAKANFVSDADWDQHSRRWSVRMMGGNLLHNRNKNRVISGLHRPDGPDAGQSYHDWASGLWNGGAAAEFTSGNCMEMASVAAMLATSPDYRFHRPWTRLARIRAPGDHVFCILSRPVPSWATADAMRPGPTDQDRSLAYVIDPWMNIACAAEEYWALVEQKLKKWSLEGKRIWWNGTRGDRAGWYYPLGEYAWALGSGPIQYLAI